VKKIFSILFVLVLVVGLGLTITTPVVAEPGTTYYVSTIGDDDTGDGTEGNPWRTIQKAIDALNVTGDGDTIMVAAGEYDYFRVEGKANIDIISTEGATVTTADWIEDLPVVGDAWVMAAVYDSPDINIEGIGFDGTGVSEENVVGIAYVDSTGVIAALTIENVVGTVGMGAGVLIADDAGFSDVEVTGSTISDNEIGIAVATDSTQEIRFSNIVNNDYGVTNQGVGTPDAIYNWWGHASGPLSVTNPFGEGNPVSDDVDFDPWLESASVTQTVTNDIVDAIDEADTIVEVYGTATLTISKYPGNPYPGAQIEGEGELASVNAETLQTNQVLLDDLFRDLYVPDYDYDAGTYVVIKIYYTDDQIDGIDDESSLRACWTNEKDPDYYLTCSFDSVDPTPQYDIEGKEYSGVITVVVNAGSSPNMDQLNGTTFGGYGSGPAPPEPCGCFIATAAYGTDTAEELDILREFRDTVLLPNRVGAEFVSLYYRASPPVADFISQNEVLRTVVRVGFVDPLVRLLTWTHGFWSP
jgi:hypothetical protein